MLLALPVSGASLNQARTLGPEIVATTFPDWWVYVVGPVLGALAGCALYKLVLAPGSREAATGEEARSEQPRAA